MSIHLAACREHPKMHANTSIKACRPGMWRGLDHVRQLPPCAPCQALDLFDLPAHLSGGGGQGGNAGHQAAQHGAAALRRRAHHHRGAAQQSKGAGAGRAGHWHAGLRHGRDVGGCLQAPAEAAAVKWLIEAWPPWAACRADAQLSLPW